MKSMSDASMLLASMEKLFAGTKFRSVLVTPKMVGGTPMMVTSSPEEIDEHNAAVTTRQVLRSITKPWKGPSNKANWNAVRANK